MNIYSYNHHKYAPKLRCSIAVLLMVGGFAQFAQATQHDTANAENLLNGANAPINLIPAPQSSYTRGFIGQGSVAVFGNSIEEKARNFLSQYGRAFTRFVKSGNFELGKIRDVDHVGISQARFTQSVKGIEVAGSYVNVSIKNNHVTSVFTSLIHEMPDEFNYSPALNDAAAKKRARQIVAKFNKISNQSVLSLSKPKLQIFNLRVFDSSKTNTDTHLTWMIEVNGVNQNQKVSELIWIDAHTGRLVQRVNNIQTAKNRLTYDSQNTSNLRFSLVRSEGQGLIADTDANQAHDYIGDAYDYFEMNHDFLSYDNQDSDLISNVHYCEGYCPMPNAFWNGVEMTYGDGFAIDDIVGHELSHGVVQSTADLVYAYQSGALNESFADIFGETVDLTNGAGDDAPANRWLLGEEIGAFRNMANPNQFNDPATTSDPFYECTDYDYGGVHINSGVPNKAFTLMVDGGSFNGQTVTSIGIDKAGKIQFRALSQHLGQSSTMADNYAALNQSCSELIGTSNITANDCAQVLNAVNAVEMNGPICEPEPVEFCPIGQAMNSYYSDGFENISNGNWVDQSLTNTSLWNGCAGVPDIFCTDDPYQGTYSTHGRDREEISDSTIVLKNGVQVKPGSKLQIYHKYDFENGYDGGVIEYTTDNESTWHDLGDLHESGESYTATVSPGYGNPLADRMAFTGSVNDYVAVVYDLSSLSGKTIKIRSRIGTDSGVGGYLGWLIDDLNIYTCGNDDEILDYIPAILK